MTEQLNYSEGFDILSYSAIAEYLDYHDHRFGDCESAVQNLRKFFGVCVQRGLGIAGRW